MSERPRECRACRRIVRDGDLACHEHWVMLPPKLQATITKSLIARAFKDYGRYVREADAIWQDAGVWRPGIAGDKPTLEVLRERGEI